jgi:DNA replication protein DnaC
VSALTTDRIHEHAARLGLTHLGSEATVVAGLVERAEQATMWATSTSSTCSWEEELGLREGRRFRNALKLSGLPHHKTLAEFDFTFQPDLDPRKVRDLATLEFVRAKSNAALLGRPGVGKTMIAVALAVAACQAGFSIYFTTLDDLVRRLRTAEATGRFSRQLGSYLRPTILVVDEVGYLPLDRTEANRSSNSSPVATTRLDDRHLEQGLHRMGRRPRRRHPRHRHPRPAPAPLRRHRHQRPQLPTQDRLNLVTGGEPMP